MSAGLAAPSLRAAPSPVDGTEGGTDVMAMLLFLPHVVGKVCCVPDNHVLVTNVLPIDETVDVGCEGRANGHNTVVDLRLTKTQNPKVAASEVTCDAVFRSRDQVVG